MFAYGSEFVSPCKLVILRCPYKKTKIINTGTRFHDTYQVLRLDCRIGLDELSKFGRSALSN
ncbi:hypothetical protein GCM10007895_05280 [Paraferrimonas sedimenticola]|uniref:Uncharacterized protein n=1 Tax=Paraferrimonas sedimenticola TaxID=375674 RepID=A0AA37RUR5_9GAMM|nr:hypothetical protein GCM10007895_05280 [Paraferrimonas sedimenticola]